MRDAYLPSQRRSAVAICKFAANSSTAAAMGEPTGRAAKQKYAKVPGTNSQK
jgi:hypothetical protein